MWTVSVGGRIGIVDRETVSSIKYRVCSISMGKGDWLLFVTKKLPVPFLLFTNTYHFS